MDKKWIVAGSNKNEMWLCSFDETNRKIGTKKEANGMTKELNLQYPQNVYKAFSLEKEEIMQGST